MKKFIAEYNNPNEERINFGLIERKYDDDLVQYIVNACKSFEVLKYITFLGYDYIDDESKIDINNYITKRKKNKKKGDKTKYMYLEDSRYGELELRFKLECKGESTIIKKKLLIPVPDENGYYTIKGKKYFLLYQLVESSTYTTRDSLTLKSFMSVSLKRDIREFTDTDGETYTAPVYVINIFRKEMIVLLFYFAKIGVKKTLKYFSVDEIVDFKNKEEDKENNIYFQISSKLFLEVNRHFFQKYQYVQSIVFMILGISTNRLCMENLHEKSYWIEKIGSVSATNVYNYYEKGMNTLTFFDRMLDETTKKILKVHDSNKKNIYAVIRWMIQNYNELRKKENLDLDNKRLRCNEYIASLLTKALSERVNRIISLGNRVTLDKVKEIFRFPGDIILQQLYRSGLLKYDDKVNDMDFFSKLRYTIKGPNSLGNKNKNTISIKYRGIHPSYVGRIDLNVCGNSDPGTTGIITPFCETDGLYFNNKNEPENFKAEFEKDLVDYFKDNSDDLYIYLDFKNDNEYYEIITKLDNINKKFKITEKEKDDLDYYYIDIKVNGKDDDDI